MGPIRQVEHQNMFNMQQDDGADTGSSSSSVEHAAAADPLAILASTWTRMGSVVTGNHSPKQQVTTMQSGDTDLRVYSPEQYCSPHFNNSFSPASVTLQRSWTLDQTDTDFVEDDTPPSIIHDEARVCNWEHVLSLCKTHPHLAAYISPRESQTALHHACDRRCPIPSVFESLIRAFPEALVLTDQKGWTPLHCACRFKAPLEAIEILLHLFPDYGRAAAQEKCKVMGRIPLFYALRYEAPVGVVELLLEYIQDVEDILDRDKVGMSILSLVWDSWAIREGKPHLAPILQQFEQLFHSDFTLATVANTTWPNTNIYSTTLHQQLSKVELILKGAFRYRPNDKRKWRLLHACASMNCHLTLFMVACILYPQQARELDEDDLYYETSVKKTTEQFPANQQTALHLAAKAQSQGIEGRKVLMAVLILYPEAAALQNPRDNCFPLHYLCKNERKAHWFHDGFRDVFDAYQEAILKGNYLNQLPLHLAASVSRYRPSPVIDHVHQSTQQHAQDAQNPLHQHPTVDAVGSIIQNLIEAYPESSRQADHHGTLPFHCIAKNSEFWTLDVEVLYMSYPHVIHTATKADGNLPLHWAACNTGARGDFIHSLVKLYPSGSTIANNQGKLPIHLACEAGKNWNEGVECIYNAYKEALSVIAGHSGKLPIHFAASSKACPKELLVNLIERNIKSTLVKDSRGQTPLHQAIESGIFWDEGLEVLIQAGPDSLDIVDDQGFLPFVLAALKYCNQTNRHDDRYSIHRVETLYELLQRVPYILSHYRNGS